MSHRHSRNLLEAARRRGIERFVYTSTVGCIGIPHGGVGDETMPVTLAEIKADPTFKTFALVRISRLSVMPVSDAEWDRIIDKARYQPNG